MKRTCRSILAVTLAISLTAPGLAQAPAEVDRLVAAMLAETPIVADLQSLLDEIGGRPTGEASNLRSVDWALERFRAIGVDARKEAFPMPARWSERSASAEVGGDASFAPRVVAMPFSTGTPATGLAAPLLDGGFGTDADLARLGDRVKGTWVLVETHELIDVDGLFREYGDATQTEARFLPAGVAGLVYMSSRPNGLLYRHNASLGADNRHPLLIMEREEAQRALRLMRAGKRLTFTAKLDVESGGPYESYNVIGEIRGRERPGEVVLIGAHLDSWGLGTGANDNGCNVALVIDLARQIKRLGLAPRRTIRFALWNGEEQGILGSWGYTVTHAAELDRHVMASSYDIGSGRIDGFFTNGRAELGPLVDLALRPVAGLGPFQQINAPIVGTDNLDFMLSGVPNLVASQESANYGPNYHARSDTFDKVNLRQLKLNAAVAAAVTWGFATMDERLPRQSRAAIEQLMQTTDLDDQLKLMGMWKDWESGKRGIRN